MSSEPIIMEDPDPNLLTHVCVRPSGEPVLGSSKARPHAAVRPEAGGLKAHDAGLPSGSESRDQLRLSSC